MAVAIERAIAGKPTGGAARSVVMTALGIVAAVCLAFAGVMWVRSAATPSLAGNPTRVPAGVIQAAVAQATATLVPLTMLVISRALLLNGLLGIAFGYLYRKRGLEAAMISHFSADLILHVLLAL